MNQAQKIESQDTEAEVDQHVGVQLRTRRVQLEMSQTLVADKLGLTFQQIQKYERGYNRVSASRLYDLTEILDVDIAFFFQGFRDWEIPESPAAWTSDVWELIEVFNQLPANLRMSLRLLLKSVPPNFDEDPDDTLVSAAQG
jgi:transcriptional regulator with XRE-family HTH domain